MLRFNGVELTEETIINTRKWFHDNAYACIEEAKSGKVYVNDLERYVEKEKKRANEYMQGEHDKVFSFVQRAYFIQTGESVPLLNF